LTENFPFLVPGTGDLPGDTILVNEMTEVKQPLVSSVVVQRATLVVLVSPLAKQLLLQVLARGVVAATTTTSSMFSQGQVKTV
jgi:hypothetical protein